MEQGLWALSFVLVLLKTTVFCLGFVEEMSFEQQGVPISQDGTASK